MAIDYGRLDVMGDSKFGDDFKEEARTREMSDRDWLKDASERILGRQLSDKNDDGSAGADWRGQLASGSSRDDIMDQMIKSDEYQARDKAVKDYRVANKGENPEESWLDAKVGAQGWKDKTPAEKADSAKQGQASAAVSFTAGQQAAKQGITLPEGAKDNVHFSVGQQTAKETKNEPYEIVIENDKSPYNAGKGETPPDSVVNPAVVPTLQKTEDKGVSTSATTDINQHRDPNDPKHAPSYRDTKVVYPGQTGENPHESKKPHYAGKPGPGYQGSTDKSGYATGQTTYDPLRREEQKRTDKSGYATGQSTYEERRAQRKKDRQAQEYQFQATDKGAARNEQSRSESPGVDFVKKYAAGPSRSFGSNYQR
tara:strand:- start:3861 stop:4967 length:1107 start_codon:yes stop_codon:yes gene_type:complete